MERTNVERYEIEDYILEDLLVTEEGKLFVEYNKLTGGDPIGLIVPFGYPKGVNEMGGVIPVYKKCIEQGSTWQELLNYKTPEDAIV